MRYDEDDDEKTQTFEVPSIEAIESVKKYKTCALCKANTPAKSVLGVVLCDNCCYSARSDNCKTTIYAVVVINTGEDETKQLTIFEDLLREVIGESQIETEEMETESVIEKSVFLKKMNITFNERNVVTSISFYE